ncbi:hypothetical protein [Paenibacillus piscarius]|uniref:hypothetical protein n=1 Tax=Paenibacillus piscarius TaxID=1089681 RepID=UPI001EE96E1F|nr:hypothetical protein [Paenibacillus piscarius]
MKYQVNKGFIKHEGVLHPRGSFFDADPSEVAHLSSQDIALVDGSFVADQMLNKDLLRSGYELQELPTVEDFGKMKAAKQKEFLLELGIEPDSNEEQRLQQYSDYYDQAETDEDV